jgi:ferredoxin
MINPALNSGLAAASRQTGTGAARLLSVNVGRRKNVDWEVRTVYTDIFKHPVDGPVRVRRLLASLRNAHEHVFYSAAIPDERRVARASPGRITDEHLRCIGVPPDAHAYVCGPSPFMAAIRGALVTLGLKRARIRTEIFGALPPITPGIVGGARREPHQPRGLPGDGPLVTFARSRLSTPFQPHRGNLLELAEACDVATRWSCRTGVCHTCVTPLLGGGVTYQPEPLERPGRGQVLICSARPETDIVLDL